MKQKMNKTVRVVRIPNQAGVQLQYNRNAEGTHEEQHRKAIDRAVKDLQSLLPVQGAFYLIVEDHKEHVWRGYNSGGITEGAVYNSLLAFIRSLSEISKDPVPSILEKLRLGYENLLENVKPTNSSPL